MKCWSLRWGEDALKTPVYIYAEREALQKWSGRIIECLDVDLTYP